MSFVCWTMSNALEKSIDMATVRCGGLSWLKPRATLCVRGRSAVVVECRVLKPCCVGEMGRVLSSGRSNLSRTLTVGHMREMGRCPGPELAGFPGFRTGTVIDCFHIAGMLQWLKERL